MALALFPRTGAAAPLGSPEAKPGGTFVLRYGEEPPTLNPLLPATDSSWVSAFVLESLLGQNPETYEWEPALAENFQTSEAGRSVLFTLRKSARWSDGVPVTTADVLFSYQLNFDDRYPSAERRAALEAIESVAALDARRVRVRLKQGSFVAFRTVASLKILPRHVYEIGARPAAVNLQYPVGSGPYRFDGWLAGRSLTLAKNDAWWGRNVPANRGRFLPARVVFRFVGSDNLAYEMLKNGDLDFMGLTPEQYLKARDAHSSRAPYHLQRVRNRAPTFMNTLVLNLRHPLFGDRRVRRALAMMIDRPTIARTFFRGLSDLAAGPWYNESPFADPGVPPIPYDRAGAIALLKEAGWQTDDAAPFFYRWEKGEKRELRFTVITSNRVALRHLTFIREDAARAGVDLQIKLVDRTAFTRALDERSFEVADYGWGSPVEFDPAPAWACGEAARGLNVGGFCDPRVDDLLGRAARTPSLEARVPILREAYRLIAEEVPQLFLLNENSTYYAVSRRVGRARPFFRFDAGVAYMWIKGNSPAEAAPGPKP